MEIGYLQKEFEKVLGGGGSLRTFFAPGRVNIIGEHIDYNGGYVFPCAIDLGTYLVARKREDRLIRGYSANFPGVVEADLDNLEYEGSRGWFNYVTGVFSFMKVSDYGFDLFFYGDLPNGAGLSSSASIELVTAYCINSFYNLNIDKVDLALLCQQVENRYIGVKCGIMDQFSVAMGKKDHGILLNCNTLEYQYIPFNLQDKSLVIINSNIQRSLASSQYNERRESCEKALEILKKYVDVDYLCDISENRWNELKGYIEDERVRKRAKHAITENERVKRAVEALKGDDIGQLGKLMYQSHLSLKEDYEVSVEGLDLLVDLAKSCPGVWGSRLTGAGFGGCTISIVDNDRVEGFVKYIEENYRQRTGIVAECYVTKVSDGVREVK